MFVNDRHVLLGATFWSGTRRYNERDGGVDAAAKDLGYV